VNRLYARSDARGPSEVRSHLRDRREVGERDLKMGLDGDGRLIGLGLFDASTFLPNDSSL
jgi:hypothetical protein